MTMKGLTIGLVALTVGALGATVLGLMGFIGLALIALGIEYGGAFAVVVWSWHDGTAHGMAAQEPQAQAQGNAPSQQGSADSAPDVPNG